MSQKGIKSCKGGSQSEEEGIQGLAPETPTIVLGPSKIPITRGVSLLVDIVGEDENSTFLLASKYVL